MRPVLWWSNGPNTPTGYGTQTAQVVGRIARDGGEVACLANYGVEAEPLAWTSRFGDRVKVMPRGVEPFSRDVMLAYWHDFHRQYPDGMFISLADIFVVPDDVTASVDVRCWVPIEHAPLPADVRHAFGREGTKAQPIAMSKYGHQQLTEFGIDAHYIPHGIEPEFQPTEGGGEVMGVPDDVYVVSMVAANKGHTVIRKSFGEAFVAFQQLKKQRDDAFLYVHSDAKALGSVNLYALAETLGLQDRIIFANEFKYRTGGYTQEDLAAIYTRSDIILAPSMGEGFGLTPLEAAACGTPAIVSNFSAQPELACEDSYLVDGQLWWHQGRQAFLFIPYVDSIAEALKHAYDNPVPFSQSAVDLARGYDADTVFSEYWVPYLAGD